MTRSEALAIVAILEAAFPAGEHGRETVELYASLLERHDAATTRDAVEALVNTRLSAFFPPWAELLGVIHACRPKPKLLEEPMGVLPTPEQRTALAAAMQAQDARSRELVFGVRNTKASA